LILAFQELVHSNSKDGGSGDTLCCTIKVATIAPRRFCHIGTKTIYFVLWFTTNPWNVCFK